MIQRLVSEDAIPALEPGAEEFEGRSLWQDAWRRLKANRIAFISIFILAAIFAACIIGPWVSPYSYREQDLLYGAQAPSWEHPMGTDEKGRDLMTRTLHGGRVSIAVGLVATLVSLIVGVTYGAVSGYLGGAVDSFMMRVVEILYALPFLIIVILLRVFFGDNMIVLFAAIGLVEWLVMARIVRGQVVALKRQEFVEAAISLGHGPGRIIFRHILPNAVGVIIVYATLTVPAVMLLEAALSFLGLGTKPPHASWGELINEGAQTVETYPWRLIFPSIFFSLTLFCLNFLGDGLRDALDPKGSRD
jgi:oligopeptide transport system permease protein